MVTTLDEKGFEARDIMATTGHKSESSIRSYASKCPPTKRRKISNALSSNLQENQEKEQQKLPKKQPTSTVSVPDQKTNCDIIPPNPEFVEIMPGFDDQNEIDDEKIMKVLTQIEDSNSALIPQQKENSDQVSNTINVSNISNVANVSRQHPMLSQMYFPNSNVTINYNFSSK